MVIEYLNNSVLATRIADLEIGNIVKIVKCQAMGTRIYDIMNLNDTEELANCFPSVEFKAQMVSRSLEQIIQEINEGRPVITYLVLEDTHPPHAVVLRGINREGQIAYYNNPYYGYREVALTDFLTCWQRDDNVAVLLEIGKRYEKKLEFYDLEKGAKKKE
jgi:hypothetical protein